MLQSDDDIGSWPPSAGLLHPRHKTIRWTAFIRAPLLLLIACSFSNSSCLSHFHLPLPLPLPLSSLSVLAFIHPRNPLFPSTPLSSISHSILRSRSSSRFNPTLHLLLGATSLPARLPIEGLLRLSAFLMSI